MREWEELRAEGRKSVARALGDLFKRFQDEANARYSARGWKGLTLAHVQFLAEIEEGGTRLTEVAASMGTTKQYAGKLAREAEAKGLVALRDDPSDRRAVRIVPVNRGRAFLEEACIVRRELESRFFENIAPKQAQAFLAILDKLLR